MLLIKTEYKITCQIVQQVDYFTNFFQMLDYVRSNFKVIHVWLHGKDFAESGRNLIQIIFCHLIEEGLRTTAKILRVVHFAAQNLKLGSPNSKARTDNHHTATPCGLGPFVALFILLRENRILNRPIYF
jgi:hypothetical protein